MTMQPGLATTYGTRRSTVVDKCQVCGSSQLEQIFFAGLLPPANTMVEIGSRLLEQPSYPAELLKCRGCQLVQLGTIVDPQIIFPPSYAYTSGTTKILRENFAELYREVRSLVDLEMQDLVVDIGSNDGTLLSNFKDAGHRVRGIEPTRIGELGNERGIPTLISFFGPAAARTILGSEGHAKLITATNVFAHIEDIHPVVDAVIELLDERGVFVTESHYWMSLLQTIQYDTIYHEHLRYYSLTSLRYLLEMHGLEVFYVKRIPTHGGSIRVYAARKGLFPVLPSVAAVLEEEASSLTDAAHHEFRRAVVASKLGLYGLIKGVKAHGGRIHGIGAPTRGSTLINYVGLDEGIIDCVLEVKGSFKIGKYIPGTLIPVFDESRIYAEQPECALLFSWHIADELIPKLAAQGFRGDFIVPLPRPRIVRNPGV